MKITILGYQQGHRRRMSSPIRNMHYNVVTVLYIVTQIGMLLVSTQFNVIGVNSLQGKIWKLLL